MNGLLIIGAGGHGKVIYEAAILSGNFGNIGFLDDSYEEDSKNELNVIGKIEDYNKFLSKYKNAFVAIGNNERRVELINKLLEFGYKVPAIIHPKAYLSTFSKVGKGTVLLAGSVVNVNSKIGIGNIININSTVDHDCILKDGCHVCSGAIVRSMVTLGKKTTVGAGALIKSGQVIKEGTIIKDGEKII
ncbi:NeuD/PglB/VioB family sugar acetyltransferase [Clostridium sp.]|uniref:NeuD/PglB/VioB family sugar acetyltransferase n=1 Tax=Clostridium sp. TaxID=1506 RepID=UPI00260FEE13|nr:NeuD/PglB/VioB family sugar acetyltransferase [Clostridium sp.]